MFHGHLSGDDERLATLVDPTTPSVPRLSPRRALGAVAAQRAGEAASAAVEGAIERAAADGGAAWLRIVDAVDPLTEQTASLRLTPSDVDGLSFAELALAVRSLTPSSGSVEPQGASVESEGQRLPLLEAKPPAGQGAGT